MKKLNTFALFCLLTTSLFSQKIDLKDITNGKYQPKRIASINSSTDGEHYFKAENNNSLILKYSFKTGLVVDTIFDTNRARECTFNQFDDFIISPDEKRLIVNINTEYIYRHSFKADYYYYDIRRNYVRKLTEKKQKQMAPLFSKDGRMLAYVCDNNIWLAKFDFDTESQITKDGEAGKIINGATDWVYEEEFATTQIMDFSPDNKLLAFIRFDETNVPLFSFQVYNHQLYPTWYSFKYPKAGEMNSKVTCNVFDIESKTTRIINVPTENMEYMPQIQFANENQLAIMTLNREQNEFNLYFANPRSSISKLILQEKNDKYIDSELLKSIHFLPNEFVYLSEKNGYSHIYLYSANGVLQKQLTTGSYDVLSILSIDPDTKTVFYESSEESPLKRTINKISITKGVKSKLSPNSGHNSADFSKKGKYFINTWSDINTPPSSSLYDTNGKLIRVLESNEQLKKELLKLQRPVKEFIKIPTKKGDELNAWILKPTDFDPSKQYPLVMVQYSGPKSQEVLDRFKIDWVDYLVDQNYIVACVDGVGTGARGEEFRKRTYMNLGIHESDSQIEAANYLGTFPYINKERIAIWGWSFGGYTTLMSMSRSNVFKAGIAIAPVTDWRLYDSVYTERFMRTPQQNESGYLRSSAIQLADKLSGNLLLIHGSADDNVHYQNTMEYTRALIKANKQFDMFTFTDQDHSIRGGHNRAYLYEKIIEFLNTNL